MRHCILHSPQSHHVKSECGASRWFCSWFSCLFLFGLTLTWLISDPTEVVSSRWCHGSTATWQEMSRGDTFLKRASHRQWVLASFLLCAVVALCQGLLFELQPKNTKKTSSYLIMMLAFCCFWKKKSSIIVSTGYLNFHEIEINNINMSLTFLNVRSWKICELLESSTRYHFQPRGIKSSNRIVQYHQSLVCFAANHYRSCCHWHVHILVFLWLFLMCY